jgi:hypothetical protein
MPDKVQKLKNVLELLKNDLSKEEFLAAFKKVLDLVKTIKERNDKELSLLQENFRFLSEKIKTDYSSDIDKFKTDFSALLKKEIETLKTDQAIRFGDLSEKLTLTDTSVAEVKERAIPTIEELENDIPKLGEKIRDSLELLIGDDRLDKSAIKGLEEDFKALEDKIMSSRKLGGGTPRLRVIKETPSGTINSSNTTFTISKTPMIDLDLFLNGALQREGATYEYTISGKTITYNSAPPTGSQHYVKIYV